MEVIRRLLFRERGRKQDMLWQVHSRTAYYRYRILVQPVTLFLYTYTAYVYHHSISIITIYTIYTTILHACSASSTTTPAIYAMQLTGATCPLGNTPVIPYAIMHIYTIPALRTQSAGHSRYIAGRTYLAHTSIIPSQGFSAFFDYIGIPEAA